MTASAAQPLMRPLQRHVRPRRPIERDDEPADALMWETASGRYHALQRWRRAVAEHHGNSGRIMNVTAFFLGQFSRDLFYATVDDDTICRETFIQRNHVLTTISALVDQGFLVRQDVYMPKLRRRERRLWARIP